jgi:hypothetical protein
MMKLPWRTKTTVSTLGMSRWTTTAMANLGCAVITVQLAAIAEQRKFSALLKMLRAGLRGPAAQIVPRQARLALRGNGP